MNALVAVLLVLVLVAGVAIGLALLRVQRRVGPGAPSLVARGSVPSGLDDAARDAAIEATFFGVEGSVRVANVDGSFYDFRCELLRGTCWEPLVEPPDEWPGRAAVAWARRVAAGERFDSAEGAELVGVAEILDRVYGR